MDMRFRTLVAKSAVFIIALATMQSAAAMTNSSSLDFTFMMGFSSATSSGGLSGDETDNIGIEIPDGFNNFVFDAPRNGTTSFDVTHTLGLNGPTLDDFDAVAIALDPNYDPNGGDEPPLYFDPFRNPAAGPDLVVQGSINATATSPASGPALHTTVLGDEITNLYGYYNGSHMGPVTLAFNFDMAWTMLLENNANADGSSSARISVEVFLRDGNSDVVDSYLVTSCAVCGGGNPPSIGNTNTNNTQEFNQGTSDVGGPVNVGLIELVHPSLYDDGYFELEVVTEWQTSAIIDPVPIPAPVWLFGSALVVLLRARKK